MASIASVPNRTRTLAAIGGVLPALAAGDEHTCRVVALHGPAALPTAVAVDDLTARDRCYGRPRERWELEVVDADAAPRAVFARRKARTVVLACSRQPLPDLPGVERVCCE